MPLKHSTETVLVILLGVMTLLAGLAVAVLPPLSQNAVPWFVAFLVSIAYPLALYPLLRERRADYEFRAMHFFPALILLFWMLLQVLGGVLPAALTVLAILTWGWSLPLIIIGFILLLLFCAHVLRQRSIRSTLLLLLLVPFVALGVLGEQFKWNESIASLLQPRQGSGVIVAAVSSASLQASSDTEEEEWREQLREMEAQRQARLRDRKEGKVTGAKDAAIIAAVPQAMGSSSSKAPHLPTSGVGIEHFAILGIALYCAALHRRTMLRAQLV